MASVEGSEPSTGLLEIDSAPYEIAISETVQVRSGAI